MTFNHPIIDNHLNKIVFIFSLFLVFSPAFLILTSYTATISENPDIYTYLGLAEGNFNQSLYRKYRVIIPFFAAIINFIFGTIFTKLKPWSFDGDFALWMSFFTVNIVIISLAATFLFQLLHQKTKHFTISILGIIIFLISRWTIFSAAVPIVDSLYILSIILLINGILLKQKNVFIIAIFIGPWAKESFLFFVPLMLLFSPIKWYKTVLLLGISGIVVFSFRYCFDIYCNVNFSNSIKDDLDCLNNIFLSLKRLFSIHGLYDIFSIIGLWNFVFIFLFNKKIRQNVFKKIDIKFSILFFLIVLFHALISIDIPRMMYLLIPIEVLILAYIFVEIDILLTQKLNIKNTR